MSRRHSAFHSVGAGTRSPFRHPVGAGTCSPFHHPVGGRACPARTLPHSHPLIFHIVGRGLDPSAGRRGRHPLQRWPENHPAPIHARGGLRSGRPTISRSPHRRGGVHPSRAPSGPAPVPPSPPRRGRACPARAFSHNHLLIFHIVGRGLDPSAGRRGRRPLQGWPETTPHTHARPRRPEGRPPYNLPFPQPVGEGFIPPAPLSVVLHLTIHHPVGAGHARPATLRCHPLLFYTPRLTPHRRERS